MNVGAIVLNYNSSNDTVKYVKKLNEYDCINKIIVVDNLSNKQGEIENLLKLKSKKTDVIRAERNGGYSYGNNFGIKYLEKLNEKIDYIIISNPDVEVKESAIKKCLDFLEKNEKAALCAPRMVNGDGKAARRSSWKIRKPLIDMVNSTRLNEILFWKVLRKGEYKELEFKNPVLEVEAISGAFFIIKYDLFKEMGFFDENVFLFYEEDILGTKIKEIDYKEYSLNDIYFKHFESQTISKAFSYFKKIRILQKSKMYYQKKYNKINVFEIFIFYILNIWRLIELVIEIPIRKLLKK